MDTFWDNLGGNLGGIWKKFGGSLRGCTPPFNSLYLFTFFLRVELFSRVRYHAFSLQYSIRQRGGRRYQQKDEEDDETVAVTTTADEEDAEDIRVAAEYTCAHATGAGEGGGLGAWRSQPR